MWGEEPPPWVDEPDGSTVAELQLLLRRQKELLVAVATGTSIATKQEEFSYRQEKLRRAYRRLGLDNPFPWTDLYSFWSFVSEWSTYAERRTQLAEIMDEALDALEAVESGGGNASEAIPAWDLPPDDHWSALAERATDLKTEYEAATTVDDFQDVGRRARQIITEAVKLAWDESMVPEGEDPPAGDDATSKLEQVLAARLPGPGSGRIRKFTRSSLALGHETTHSESQEGLEAMASAMGAIMSVRLLQEIDGLGPH